MNDVPHYSNHEEVLKDMVRALVVSLMVLVTFSGCVSQRVTEETPRELSVSLLYQSNRYGVLEPCGCDSKPWGGIDREANAVEAARSARRAVFYVDAGNSLAPAGAEKRLKHHQEKGESIARMLDTMGLDLFAPGPTDFALGTQFLKSLMGRTRFAWVATNVVTPGRAPVFSPYLIFERGGVRFAFLAVTPSEGIADTGLVVEEPASALSRWLVELEGKADVVVLLSQLGTREDKAIAARFPEIQVIVGSDNEYSHDEPLWVKGHTIILDPHVNGYLLGRLDMDLRLPFTGLYSESAIAANRQRLERWQAMLDRDPDDTVAKRFVDKIRATDALEVIPGGTHYQNELLALDAKRFGAKNSISLLVEKEKERIRHRALQLSE